MARLGAARRVAQACVGAGGCAGVARGRAGLMLVGQTGCAQLMLESGCSGRSVLCIVACMACIAGPSLSAVDGVEMSHVRSRCRARARAESGEGRLTISTRP